MKDKLLQLFAEAAQTGAAPAAEGTTGETAEQSAAGAVSTDEEFDALVKKGGKYADAFQKKVQAGFNEKYRRFKETEEKATALEKFKSVIAADYAGVDANDLDALEKAYLTDERRFAKQALENGEDAKELAEKDYTKRKLSEYERSVKEEQVRRAQQKEAEKFYARISAQEKDMKAKYPDFDLESELKDATFRAIVKSGASLESAYWASHRDALVEKAVNDAKNATVASIAAKGQRPTEAAASSAAPAVSKVDYSKMSRKEFMKIWNE